VFHNKLIGIHIASADGNFSIFPRKEGLYYVEEHDPGIQFTENLVQVDAKSARKKTFAKTAPIEDGSIVDVLVVYKKSAKETMGGRDEIELAIRENEVQTNTALARSQTNVQVRFVAIEEVPDNIGSTLTAFRTFRSSAFVRALRDRYKADLVIVIQNTANAAGAATVPCNLNNADYYSERAFAYVKTSYLRRIYTMSHEIGHLFGAGHSPGEVDNCTLHEDSYAHFFSARDSQGQTRPYATLLSYRNSSNRILNYSNPTVTYLGVSTGVTGSRDNAKAIRDTRVQIANYRVNR
jgi:hypothetical protein